MKADGPAVSVALEGFAFLTVTELFWCKGKLWSIYTNWLDEKHGLVLIFKNMSVYRYAAKKQFKSPVLYYLQCILLYYIQNLLPLKITQ